MSSFLGNDFLSKPNLLSRDFFRSKKVWSSYDMTAQRGVLKLVALTNRLTYN